VCVWPLLLSDTPAACGDTQAAVAKAAAAKEAAAAAAAGGGEEGSAAVPKRLTRKQELARKGSQSAQAKLGNDLAAALGRLRGIIRPEGDGDEGQGGSPHRSW
jgi:hypothetical protein